MNRLMDIFDLVPGWLYAIAVACLLVLLVLSELDRNEAITEAALAGQQLAEIKAAGSAAVASSVTSARAKESDAAAITTKVTYELHQDTANPAARAAAVERGMREPAAAYARSGGGCKPTSSSAPKGGDGAGSAGLRGLDEPDPLVLDGQAQSEIAQLTVSANRTGKTLKACRVLLREAWRMTNDAPAK